MITHVNLLELEQLVKTKMTGLEPGHDFYHVLRVKRNALLLQQTEGGDVDIVTLAALMHELPDPKFFDPLQSITLIETWLGRCAISKFALQSVLDIVSDLSFSKELDGSQPRSIEFKIVQDADRLEAIGAIGIARTFSYGASKMRPFFIEDAHPTVFSDAVAYQTAQSPTVNHFFEKLFVLKDKMKTQTGQRMAAERHRFMVDYLTHYFNETGFENPHHEKIWRDLLAKADN